MLVRLAFPSNFRTKVVFETTPLQTSKGSASPTWSGFATPCHFSLPSWSQINHCATLPSSLVPAKSTVLSFINQKYGAFWDGFLLTIIDSEAGQQLSYHLISGLPSSIDAAFLGPLFFRRSVSIIGFELPRDSSAPSCHAGALRVSNHE